MPLQKEFVCLTLCCFIAFGLSTTGKEILYKLEVLFLIAIALHFRNLTSPTRNLTSTQDSTATKNLTTIRNPTATRNLTSTRHFTSTQNVTSRTRTSSATSSCYFIVQDVVSEYWWDIFYPDPYVQVETSTSISDLVTALANSTITKHVTHLYTTKITYSSTATGGDNPFSLSADNAPKPSEFRANRLTGTQIVTGGVTVQSPTPFWVYSSVKIITVPAVTDSAGKIVCATSSYATTTESVTETLLSTASTIVTASDGMEVTKNIIHTSETYANGPTDIYTISGVNENAEAYFGGHGILGWSSFAVKSTGYEVFPAQTLTNSFGLTTTIPTYTEDLNELIYYYARSSGDAFTTYTPSISSKVIKFPTPFIYLPPCATEDVPDREPVCTHANMKEAYGYVPKAVLDHMISDPAIKSKNPGIASYLVGGPSIILQNPFTVPGPRRVPYVQTHATNLLPTSDTPEPTPRPMQTDVPNPSSQLPQPQGTPTQPLSQPTAPPLSPPAAPSESIIPLARVPESIPGTLTIIKGSTFAVISPTTLPVNPAFPLSGITTVIQDTTFVILASSTIVPIPQNMLLGADGSHLSSPSIPDLPGSTIIVAGNTTPSPTPNLPHETETMIPSLPGITMSFPDGAIGVILVAGATIPVNPAYSVKGLTTVIDGTSEIIIPSPTTLRLSPQKESAVQFITGITTILPDGETAFILASGASVPVDRKLSLSGRTTVIDGKTEVILTAPATITLQTKTSIPSKTKSFHSGAGSTELSTRSDTTNVISTSSSTQTVDLPSGSSVLAGGHKSGGLGARPGMKWGLTAWIGVVLLWSFS
jgi:hypothetical protein